jgi:hypothetical protein
VDVAGHIMHHVAEELRDKDKLIIEMYDSFSRS